MLVDCVEALGEDVADGRWFKIKILEIPADIDFVIHCDDGVEWIQEVGREWHCDDEIILENVQQKQKRLDIIIDVWV